MASYSSGNITYTLTSTGLQPAVAAAQSINQNMTQAAASASGLGKTAAVGLAQANRAMSGVMGGGSGGGSGGGGNTSSGGSYGQARGNTGQTKASARDFANQAEGLGGLVRLYATFAANIFAVSMAFEALKRSFQFEQLQKASEAFAVSTGKNLSGVAADLQKLSQGVLTDKAAQQMANYGSSAGFTSEQMKRIVNVARGASQALGRDMGDAIDRLMRGTGKLEPELLDELGLLTRTKEAATAYGKSIGKTFEQLTQFEKTQGFINAVLKEGEEKFGAVSKAVESSPFERFTASLLSMGTAIGNVVNKALVPILNFFANNPTALILAMAAAFTKLLITALPALANIGAGAQKAADIQKVTLEGMKDKALEVNQKMIANERSNLEAKKAILRQESLAYRQAGKDIESQRQASAQSAKQLLNQSNTSVLGRIASDGSAKISMASFNQAIAQTTAGSALNKILTEQKNLQIQINDKYVDRFKVVENIKAITEQIKNIETSTSPSTSKSFNTSFNKATIDNIKAAGVANAAATAQTYGLKAAFTQLGTTMDTVNTKHRELYNSTGTFMRGVDSISRGVSVAGVATKGFFSIMTVGIGAAMNALGPWIMAFSVISAAVVGLIDIFGGFSKKIDEVNGSQDELNKSLSLSGSQAKRFAELQTSVDSTATSLQKLREYGVNVGSGLQEALSKSTKAFKEFISESDGGVTRLWDSIKKSWGGDTLTKQINQLSSSISTILATTSAQDMSKVTKAILNSMPDVKSVDELLTKLKSLSSGQIADIGSKLSENLAAVNIQLKSSVENAKNAANSWKSLEDAVDKYNKKEEVKDPKLAEIVKSLKAINAAYASATTEQERANILNNLDIEVQDKLVKLAQSRGVEITGWVASINAARAASAAYAAEEAAAAARNKIASEDKAFSYLDNAVRFKNQLDQIEQLEKKIKEVGRDNVSSDDRRQYELLTKGLEQQLKVAAEKAGTVDPLSKSILLNYEASLESAFNIFSKKMVESKASLEAAAKGITITVQAKKAVQQKLSIPTTREDIAEADKETYLTSLSKKANMERFKDGENLVKKLSALKTKEHTDTVAKSYEFEVKAATALEAQKRKILDIEKESIGYATAVASEELRSASVAKAVVEYNKEIEQIRVERENNIKKNVSDAEARAKAATAAANEELDTKKKTADLEAFRTEQAREKFRYDKFTVDWAKEELSVRGQILDALSSTNNISVLGAAAGKAKIAEEQSILDINVKRFDLIQKENELKRLEDSGKDTSEGKSVLQIQRDLLTLQEKRAVITKDITVEQAKQKQFWDQISAVSGAIGNIFGIQLKYTTLIASAASNRLKAAILEKNTTMEISKSYLERARAAGIELKSEEGILLQEEAILELTDKIYEQRVRQAELNAKNNSGVDFITSLSQAFEIESQKFNANMKSVVNTIKDGIIAAMDAPIEYVMNTLKGGGKLNFSSLLKTVGDSLKNSLYEAATANMKSMAREFVANLFETTASKALKPEAIQKAATEAIKENSQTITNMQATSKSLIEALDRLTFATQNKSGGGINAKTVDATTTQMEDLGGYFDSTSIAVQDTGESVSQFSVTTSAAADTAGWFGSMVGAAGGAVGRFINSMGGTGWGAAAGVAGAAISGGSGAALNAVVSLASSTAMSAAASFGTAFVAGVGEYYAGITAATVGAEMVGAGAVGAASVGGAASAGLTAGLAAIPVAGWIALAAILIYGIATGMDEGDAMRTINWSNKLDPSTNKDPNQRGQSAFGSYGISSSKWLSSEEMGADLKKLMDSIKGIDNAIAAQVGQALTTAIKGRLESNTQNGATYLMGMEHTDFNKTGMTGLIIIQRYQTVLNTISDGLGDFLNKFEGSGQDLANLILGLVSMNTILNDTGYMLRTFGESFDIKTVEGLGIEGENVVQTFSRITTEFNITNSAAELFGISITDAFGKVGLAGLIAREGMIAAAGGLDAFNSKVTFMAEHFYTAAERQAISIKSATSIVEDGFATLGVTMPKNGAEFRAMVEKAFNSGDQDLWRKLTDLAPAFATLTEYSDSLAKALIAANESMGMMVNISSLWTTQMLSAADVEKLAAAGIAIDKFASDVANLANLVMSPSDLARNKVWSAGEKLYDKKTGYTALTGQTVVPLTREELYKQWVNEIDPVKKAIIATFTDSFRTIFEAEELLTKNTKDVSAALQQLGLTTSEAMIKMFAGTQYTIEDYIKNIDGFYNSMFTDTQKTALAVAAAKTDIGSKWAQESGGKAIPTTRAEYIAAVGNAKTDVERAALMAFWKDFDTIFSATEADIKAAADAAEKLAEETKKLSDALSSTGIVLNEGLKTALTSAGINFADFADQVSIYSQKFLTDSETIKNLAESGRNTISASGYTGTIPKTRAAFVALMNSADATTKVILMKLVPAFDAIYSEAENYITRVADAQTLLYSQEENDALALAAANSELQNGFAALHEGIPATTADFAAMYNAAMAAGNTKLADKLLALVSPFMKVTNAAKLVAQGIKEAVDSIMKSAKSFIDEIESSIYAPDQLYKKYKDQADTAQAGIDALASMSDEEIQAKINSGELSKDKVTALYNSAEENARKAWGLLDDEQKKVLGPAFLTFMTQLAENAKLQIERIGNMAAKPPEPLTTVAYVPPAPVANTVGVASVGTGDGWGIFDPGNTLADFQVDPATKITTAYNTGASVVGTSITDSITTGAAAISSAITSAAITAAATIGSAITAATQPLVSTQSATGTTINGQSTTGASTVSSSVTSGVFGNSGGTIGGSSITANNAINTAPGVDTTGPASNANTNDAVDRLLSDIDAAFRRIVIPDQELATLTESSNRILAAADMMLGAATGQQEAANTVQRVAVDVNLSGLAPIGSEV